jgi:DNA-binding transcriptional ArsR family regulator
MGQIHPTLEPVLKVSAEQLGLMSFGPRREIIAALANDANLSARELAARLRRPVTSLYRHLGLLLKAGLIRASGQRLGQKRPETLFSLTFATFSAIEATDTPEGRTAMAQAASRYAGAATRKLSRAIDTGAARFVGSEANAGFAVTDLQLDDAGLAQLHRLLRKFIIRVRKLRVPEREGVETVTVTIIYAPDS